MLLVGNGLLVTRDTDNPLIENGCVAVDGASICSVGPTGKICLRYPHAEFVDAAGGLIMPGLINAHGHFYSSFSRGFTPPGKPAREFVEVLERLWWRLDKALSIDDIYYSTMTAAVDAIRCGCTTIIDHHASPNAITGSLFEIAKATRTAGVRASLCYEVSERDGPERADEGVEENIDFIDWAKRQNDPTLSGKFGLHASFTLSDAILEKCAEKMSGRESGFHVHVAEGAIDEQDSAERYGIRIAERFRNFGITGENSIFAHCVHIDKSEREIIKETGTSVVHNPESNMGNAVGATDVTGLMSEGIRLGLGTDGFACDMLLAYRLGNALCKHLNNRPNVGWTELHAMLFENNAKIAERCFPVKLGKLAPGYAADVIVMDYLPPTPISRDNINSHLLFGASGRGVVTTIASGKLLMKDGVLTSLDKEEIFAKARECAERVWKKI